MYFSGIADEAGKDLDTQIRAHKELGWSHIEMRTVDGVQFTDLPDDRFEQAVAKLDAAGLKISCYASAIANWASKITDPLERDIETLERAIPRMKRTGTPFIRVMGWPNDGFSDEQWRDEALQRMRKLVEIAEQGGVQLVLENCEGWPCQSIENTQWFFDQISSPAFRAVYDTGNPEQHGHTNTWQWYEVSKPYISYVHIKVYTGGENGKFVFPDEPSPCHVQETLRDLFQCGYDGGISIEPHLESVIHAGQGISDAAAAYQSYIEYGQRLMKLVEQTKMFGW